MSRPTISLSPVDAVKVTLIMDNTFDVLMTGNEVVRRFPLRIDFFEHETPLAEHGFSALIEVERDGRKGVVLFDTGVSRTGILRNMDVLQINARVPAGFVPTGILAVELTVGLARSQPGVTLAVN